VGDPTSLGPGFPIRTSSDHSSVDSSPRLIAASYVLHRLLVPRHPPCALKNLATKMLASTVQFSNNTRTPIPTAPPTPTPQHRVNWYEHQDQDRTKTTPPTQGWGRVFSQDPTVHRHTHHPPPHRTGTSTHEHQRSTHEQTPRHTNGDDRGHNPPTTPPPKRERPPGERCELLRKEVIQPHLPVRLPCYDFVPIADPTFDSSLPYGLGHWLRVLPTFVT